MESLVIQIASLQEKSVKELQEVWKQYFNEPSIVQNKEYFISRIAYRIQELAYGGLTSCTTNINGNYCLLYEPIYADYDNDTAETIRQIDRNNVIYDGLCSD